MTDPRPPAGHILSFAQTLNGGGVERALLRMSDGWVRAGRRVTLAIGDPRGALAHELPDGVEVRSLGGAGYPKLFGLVALVRDMRPDIIFCPGNHYTAAAAMLRVRMGGQCPPIVGKVSNALVRPDLPRGAGRAYRAWLRAHPRFLDAIVAMTPAMAREAIAAMGVAAARVRVIANPPAQPIPGAMSPPLPDGRYLLGVGRLAPQKRWERLIAAMPRLRDADIRLVILGEGAARAALEADVRELGLHDRVSLPGHVPDPLPAIERAAVVVLTSDYEGVPGVIREAIAVGTPVVATDSSVAIGELIDSPSRGTIVPPGDAARLVAALDHWLAPGRARPAPRLDTGPDPVAAYLDLFDRLAAADGGTISAAGS